VKVKKVVHKGGQIVTFQLFFRLIKMSGLFQRIDVKKKEIPSKNRGCREGERFMIFYLVLTIFKISESVHKDNS
jgi:hypothetical protein